VSSSPIQQIQGKNTVARSPDSLTHPVERPSIRELLNRDFTSKYSKYGRFIMPSVKNSNVKFER
jgi:hypothetical protein